MIKWLKSLFEPSDSGRMVPISQIDIDHAREKREEQELQENERHEITGTADVVREYVYMGDGTIEEIDIISQTHSIQRSSRTASNLNYNPPATSTSNLYYNPTPVYSGSDYGSDSGYSSCDSSSPSSCD